MDPLPLCVQPSDFFKEEGEQPAQISEGPYEPACNKLQIAFHVVYYSCANRVYDEVKKCSSPLAGCVPQYQNVDDIQFPRHDSDPKLLYSSSIQPSNCIYMLRDPFVHFLVSAKKVSSFMIFSKVNKVISDGKISIFTTSKHEQQSSPMFIMLKWLHWLFDFT